MKGYVHHFFWKTEIPSDKMLEIQAWIDTLTSEQQDLLQLIIDDVRDDANWEDEYQHNYFS